MNENLQNQNSNQSQKHDFFAQQNKPKSDYDKEPLIIKNSNRDVNFVWTLFVVTVIIIAILVGNLQANGALALVFMIVIWSVKLDKDNPKNSSFKFTNTAIYYISENLYKEIRINEISKVSKTIQSFYEIHNKQTTKNTLQKIGNIAVVLYLLLLFVGFIVLEGDRTIFIYAFFVFVIGLFAPQYIYHMRVDKNFKDRLYDTLVISSVYDFKICIFLAKQSDYNAVREYFLKVVKKDINKIEKILF